AYQEGRQDVAEAHDVTIATNPGRLDQASTPRTFDRHPNVSAADRLHRLRPRLELVEEDHSGLRVLGTRDELREVLEVGPHREAQLLADVRDLDFAADGPRIL